MNVFTGRGNSYDSAAEQAQDSLIGFCQGNTISGNDVISLSPTVTSDQFGYTISLWLLLKWHKI